MSMADPSSPTALKAASTSSEDQEDAFLQFVEYARCMLSSNVDEDTDAGVCDGGDASAPPWSWVVSRILKSCVTYSSGVTPAILLSDLFQAWIEQRRYMTSKKKLEWKIPLEKRHKRMKLPHTVTIDSIYEKNFLSPSSVIETVVIDTFLLPDMFFKKQSLGLPMSPPRWLLKCCKTYNCRYYDLVEFQILKKGREIFLTGCCLRSAMDGSGHRRLLPTEYLIVLLDEDQDEDALLLGAQFCSDSFSSISVDAFKNDISYSFYARIDSIGSLESFRGVERKGVTLVDNEGAKIRLVLWGDQVLLANVLSPGSMLALDKPFIAHIEDANITSQELCLEFGSATRIYMVPFSQQEEQVLISSTQLRSPGSKLSGTLCQNQGLNVSQVMLPLDSQGSVDFKNYPLQLLVADLRDKMTGVSIYGVVRYIHREVNSLETIYRVKLEDTTGAIVAKLHFVRSWSLGHLGIGHSVFISGLTCSLNADKKLEVSWFEKDVGNTLVNLSCLPALLNSSCLHKSSCISDISKLTKTKTHICRTCVVSIEHHDVCLIKSHAICGYPVRDSSDGSLICSFCHLECDGEILDSFQLKVTLGDETGQLSAWCTCQTATELLQITPDEYIQLPVVEQAMYLCTLTGERLIVAVINCRRDADGSSVDLYGDVIFEVVRAQKCE